jgi:hypothetical protein
MKMETRKHYASACAAGGALPGLRSAGGRRLSGRQCLGLGRRYGPGRGRSPVATSED